MSACKTCSPEIYHRVMVRVKPVCFILFQERQTRKSNEEQIERNSNFARDDGISQPFVDSRTLLQYFAKSSFKVYLFRLFVSHD